MSPCTDPSGTSSLAPTTAHNAVNPSDGLSPSQNISAPNVSPGPTRLFTEAGIRGTVATISSSLSSSVSSSKSPPEAVSLPRPYHTRVSPSGCIPPPITSLSSVPWRHPRAPCALDGASSESEESSQSSSPSFTSTTVSMAKGRCEQVPIEEDILDWEYWKGDIPFWKHAAAGSCAGVVEHCVIYPLDTLKTRLQSGFMASSGRHEGAAFVATRASSLRALSAELYAQAGLKGFFRGLGAICVGCIPAHAALFSVFEVSKSRFGTRNPLGSALCGGLATLSHDLILTPTDVVKQRLQLGCYRGAIDCIRTVLKQEGPVAFYRSMSTTLAMNIPFGAILVTTNEALKRATHQTTTHENNLALYFLNAGIAGGVAGYLTTPMDVVKTRLQTQDIRQYMTAVRGLNEQRVAVYTTQIRTSSAANDSLKGLKSSTPLPTGSSPKAVFKNLSQVVMGTNSTSPPYTKYKSFLTTVNIILQEEGVLALWKCGGVGVGTYETVKLLLRRFNRRAD